VQRYVTPLHSAERKLISNGHGTDAWYKKSVRDLMTGSNTNKKKSFLSGIPSWASALFIFLIELILIVALPDTLGESATGEALIWTTVGVVNAICCFFIVKQNPKSIWYVLLIINALFIIMAVVMAVVGEDINLRDLLFLCGIVVLSIIASIIGARIGRKSVVSENNKIK